MTHSSPPISLSRAQQLFSGIQIVGYLYLLMVAIQVMSAGFSAALGDQAANLVELATNPFLGLMIGTLVTALIQSSSTTTSIVVGLVASGVPIATAVPIIMGANIGTSITNTLVSLRYVGERDEFQRAVSAATVLDMFNVLSVMLFFPLEWLWHPLEHLSLTAAQWALSDRPIHIHASHGLHDLTHPVVAEIQTLSHIAPGPWDLILQSMIGIGGLFLAIYGMGRVLKQLLLSTANRIIQSAIGHGGIVGIGVGAIVTMIVQSSSTTTSLTVPLVGSGLVRVADIYPFTLGANIGTCITAILAATAIAGSNALPALEIAFVHFFFNVIGVLIWFGIPILNPIPIQLADALGRAASNHRSVILAYILGLFFMVPALGLGLSLLIE